ncbi:MAG TPA: FMN-binding glutamate synthase family protein [Polyangiaceae bacterium]|nr:FMN-binding glutamate synthase family protein [Polyangiaceae bacterium]
MWRSFLAGSVVCAAGIGIASIWAPNALWAYAVVGPLIALGLVDMTQKRQAVRRNFPIVGHGRYLLEMIRPEINQYFIESNTDGAPFNREVRSLVYQRAKGENDTLPFGTQRDLYEPGAEWLTHSICPKPFSEVPPRLTIGEKTCKQPYSAALLNVSAMSFGALSKNAILALSRGAKAGGFAHNTGEGGISAYHLDGGADLVWQIGTGYFGCRAKDGGFDTAAFRERAAHPNVKMIEVKISQGAKPGHGGILPAKKLTREIADIRGVPMGQDVLSPPGHKAFSTPVELLTFLAKLRELSGGKPVGFKLCVGKRREFLAICKAMVATGEHPDFITVDGAEGGTGAAPLEFSNSLGMPLVEALVFVHNALVGIGFRERVKIFASGKVTSGFDMARLIAIGADACYSARAMMMAVGCIQARRCNNNTCPVGVATQDPELVRGLVVEDKAPRVTRFQKATVHSFLELIAASGCSHPYDLRPWHVFRRISPTEVRHYGEMFEYIEPGALLGTSVPGSFRRAWDQASSRTFDAASDRPDMHRSLLPKRSLPIPEA